MKKQNFLTRDEAFAIIDLEHECKKAPTETDWAALFATVSGGDSSVAFAAFGRMLLMLQEHNHEFCDGIFEFDRGWPKEWGKPIKRNYKRVDLTCARNMLKQPSLSPENTEALFQALRKNKDIATEVFAALRRAVEQWREG